MILDCNSCVMKDKACHDCVVTALLGPVEGSITEQASVLNVLSNAGLVAPLRLVVDSSSTQERSATG